MNRIIQITGLPRSGTAFMAAFSMLYPWANVFHENIADGGDWRGRLKDSVRDYPLTVDCGTYQYFPGAVYPGSEKIWIGRNSYDSAEAAAKAAGRPFTDSDVKASGFLLATWHKWRSQYAYSRFEFANLFNEDSLRLVWNTLDPDRNWAFPERNVRQLIRMRIVRKDVEKFSMENVEKNANELFQPWD